MIDKNHFQIGLNVIAHALTELNANSQTVSIVLRYVGFNATAHKAEITFLVGLFNRIIQLKTQSELSVEEKMAAIQIIYHRGIAQLEKLPER